MKRYKLFRNDKQIREPVWADTVAHAVDSYDKIFNFDIKECKGYGEMVEFKHKGFNYYIAEEKR